jgi:diadenosine tetraphosphatase ApaH/serine/threonine PP2A family protein phosphatase
MRYLVLADVHANLEALEAVLAAAPEHDSVIFLGDLIGYGPNPNEVTERLRELPLHASIVGNHDWAALGKLDIADFNPFAQFAAQWTADHLTPENRDYLLGLKPTADAGESFLAHGSPRDPIWEYLEDAQQATANFKLFAHQVCLVGHTHVPRVFLQSDNGRIGVSMPDADSALDISSGRFIINPGGVGQPRNGDPRSAFGLLDTDAHTFSFYRTPYDIETTQKKMLDAGLPAPLASRLRLGL